MARAERPGWAWLVAHEMRLLWRGLGSRSGWTFVLAVSLLAALHGAGYAFWKWDLLGAALRTAPAAVAVFTAFVTLLLVSSAFSLAVRALFERGDLDLLLSSPVAPSQVFVARGLGVAAGAVAPAGFFILPVAHMGVAFGRPGALAAWPALYAMGLASTAIAFAGTLALVRLIGPRRARVAAQVAGALIGAAIVLVMQLQPLLPRATQQAFARWLREGGLDRAFGADSLLLWPLRAMLGEALPLAALLAFAGALFIAVMRAAARRFVEAVQAAPESASVTPRRRGAAPFRAGLARVVVAKELKLIARDPLLVGKSLLPVVYLVPLFVVMARSAHVSEALAAALVALCASIAATLAWISVSGEEAPDLLASAPVAMGRLRALKVAGAVIPVCVLAAPFVAWLGWHAPPTAAAVALFLAFAVASAAVVQVWGTPLGAGRDLAARRSQDVLLRIVDNVSGFAWAGACYGALLGSPWMAAGVALGLVAPAVAWLSARPRP